MANGTSGFVSRFIVMSVAIDAGQMFSTVLMGITSVVLFAAYLRIPIAMYLRPASVRNHQAVSLPAVIALAICAFATAYLGFFPGEGPLPFEMLAIVERATHP